MYGRSHIGCTAVLALAVLTSCGGSSASKPTTINPNSIGTVAPEAYAEARDRIYWGVTNMAKLSSQTVDDSCLKSAVAGLTTEEMDRLMPFVGSNAGIPTLMADPALAKCIT